MADGDHDHVRAPSGGADLEDLEALLDGAALLGLELDTRYRVLAATLEPVAEQPLPGAADAGADVDRRLQLLASPVSTVLGSLRRRVPTGDGYRTEVLTFSEAQLVDVVAALDGPPVRAPLFGRPEPRRGSWAPEWSLVGRSTAGDGVTRTVTFSVRRTDEADADVEVALDLFARFDELLVRDAAGRDIATFGSSPRIV